MPAPLEHDPLACGIYPETSCPRCRAALEPTVPPLPPRVQAWQGLLETFPALQQLARGYHVGEQRPGPEMPGDAFAALIGSLCRPELREILVTALASEVIEIARAVARQEIRQAQHTGDEATA